MFPAATTLHSRIATLPEVERRKHQGEFLEKCYCPAALGMLAFMGIVAALFIHIDMSLYAGAMVIDQFFGLDVMTSIILVSLITAVYTVLGGLKAVVVTEAIQTVLLLAEQWRSCCSGIWYWCTDQTIVQRVFGARTERDAQLGPLFAGLLKILPVFLMVLPGVLSQWSSVVVMLLAMAWSTPGGRFSSIFEVINAIAADLAPPITTVFLWGVFRRRGTWQAAMWTLTVGFALGAAAFIVDLPVFGQVKWISQGLGIPFLLQAWWLFCICSGIFVRLTILASLRRVAGVPLP